MEAYSVNLRTSSSFTFIPWLTMALGSTLSGVAADAWLARSAPSCSQASGPAVVAASTHWCTTWLAAPLCLHDLCVRVKNSSGEQPFSCPRTLKLRRTGAHQ